MAETAQHHHPAFDRDRAQSKGNYSFLQTVDDIPASDTPQPKKTSNNPAGRPPLSSYLEPDDSPDFAFTSQRIEENYPFFGTLMKRENGLYKRKEVITKSEAKDIEYVKGRYGAGGYQVRQQTESGEDTINFNVSGVEKSASSPDSKETVIDEQFISGLRRDLKEEIRSDYDDLISRLEKRLQSRNDELEELSRKVRSLNMELAETERSAARSVREDHKEFERTIEQLKENKRDLEFDNFELQQELKYADAEGGFDIAGMLKDAASNPQLMNLLAPLLGKVFGGGQPAPQQPAALNGNQRANPEPDSNEQVHRQDSNVRTQHAASQPAQGESAANSDQPKPDQPPTTKSEPTQQQKMQHLVNQFSSNIIQNSASAMINGQPAADRLKKIVMQNVRQLKANGIEPEAGIWVGIAKALIEVALQNDIPAEKAAETIQPILQQFDGAASSLQYIPALGAAKVLINKYNIQVTAPQQSFLVEVLKVFKQQLKGNPAEA